MDLESENSYSVRLDLKVITTLLLLLFDLTISLIYMWYELFPLGSKCKSLFKNIFTLLFLYCRECVMVNEQVCSVIYGKQKCVDVPSMQCNDVPKV